MRIAGKKTVEDWITLRNQLATNPALWKDAYILFYMERIKTRYLDPMEKIADIGEDHGEGYSIVALFCTLVEFLESCEQGRNYEYGAGNSKFKYSKSGKMFKAFLRNRKPFSVLVEPSLRDEFYSKVRCGLLHEARTGGNWLISAKLSGGKLIFKTPNETTVYRSEILPALKQYFSDYEKRLLANEGGAQSAFIRKFDHLADL